LASLAEIDTAPPIPPCHSCRRWYVRL